MSQQIVQIAMVVKDYDEAIAFYTQKLKFTLLEDTRLSEEKRWVRIAPAGSDGFALLLAKAANEQQLASVGNQTGGRVFLFLHTDDFERDYQNLIAESVRVVSGPRDEPYGRVLVFEDLYGNLWDLIEPSTTPNV